MAPKIAVLVVHFCGVAVLLVVIARIRKRVPGFAVSPIVPASMTFGPLFVGYLVPYPAVTWLQAVMAMVGIALILGGFVALMMTPHRQFVPDGKTRCGTCGYILKGLDTPRCPECGRDI